MPILTFNHIPVKRTLVHRAPPRTKYLAIIYTNSPYFITYITFNKCPQQYGLSVHSTQFTICWRRTYCREYSWCYYIIYVMRGVRHICCERVQYAASLWIRSVPYPVHQIGNIYFVVIAMCSIKYVFMWRYYSNSHCVIAAHIWPSMCITWKIEISKQFILVEVTIVIIICRYNDLRSVCKICNHFSYIISKLLSDYKFS